MSNLIDRLWSGSRDLQMGSDLLTEAATTIATLEQQVEELTKERDERMLDKCPKLAAQVTIANEQLAALAEQNAKMRKSPSSVPLLIVPKPSERG